jgi:hypothetical protein
MDFSSLNRRQLTRSPQPAAGFEIASTVRQNNTFLRLWRPAAAGAKTTANPRAAEKFSKGSGAIRSHL